MYDININGDYQHIGTNKSSRAEKIEKEEETNLFPSLETDEILDILFTGVIDGVLGDGTFTKDEAAIFVKGEKEIAELVKNSPNDQSIVEAIFDPDKIERETRKKYADEHPEYAEVMKEGLKVRDDFEKKREETRQKWLEENSAPEMFEQGGFLGVKVTDEYKEWSIKQDSHLKDFEKNYINDNPDYANLKAELDKDKSLLDIFLGI